MRILKTLTIVSLLLLAPIMAQASEGNFTFSTYSEIGQYKPSESSYLAQRVLLTPGTESYGFAPIDNSMEYHGYGIGFSYHLGETKYFDEHTTVFGSIDVGNIIKKQNFDILDPDGLALLIPGVGVGPEGIGFELPPPLNATANTKYRSESEQLGFSIGFQKDLQNRNCKLSLSPFAGLRYRKFESNSQFSGDIPFFLSRFAYDTNIQIHSISPFIGTDFSYPIAPAISFIGSVKYMYDLNFGDGDDRLDFTARDRQTVDLNNDENSHSGEVEAGLNFQLSQSIDFSLTGKYGRYGNIPVMETRTGSRPSDFNYKTGEIITGAARVTVRF